jgi:hypothetical protein
MTDLAGQHGGLQSSTAAAAPAAPDADAPKGVEVLAPGNLLRTCFGVVLFVIWGIATVLWLWTDVHLVVHGQVAVALTSIVAIALMCLLAAMEGIEVSVIDRWQKVWPGYTESYLAGWLAARQLFVALIVTTATLLANRSAIFIPFTSLQMRGGVATGAFDIAWTTLTVLWFAQILPKHMAAINPDRYLQILRPVLFPIVAFVHKVGISLPGEWTARAVENRLDWPASLDELEQHRNEHESSPGSIWRALPLRSELRKLERPIQTELRKLENRRP